MISASVGKIGVLLFEGSHLSIICIQEETEPAHALISLGQIEIIQDFLFFNERPSWNILVVL